MGQMKKKSPEAFINLKRHLLMLGGWLAVVRAVPYVLDRLQDGK